jgi:hypothetical protein
MLPQAQQKINGRRARASAGLAALSVLLASGAGSQIQPNTTTAPQANRPATNTTAQHVQTPAVHKPLPGNGVTNAAAAANANQTRQHFWNNIFNRNNNSAAAAHPATTNSSLFSRLPWNRSNNSADKKAVPENVMPLADKAHNPSAPTRLASIDPSQRSANRAMQSQTFLSHQSPPGTRETQTAKGNIVRTAADGSIMDVRNPSNGMSIHHGLDGSRRVTVDQPDGSRVFAPSRGTPYVQHPYLFQAKAFDHRTSVFQGKVTHRFYRPYTYGGATLDAYAPTRFYQPNVYQWASTPFIAPQQLPWNYTTTPTPWFSYYKSYFTPESSYTSPSSWLADYVLASSLFAAYVGQQHSNPSPASAAATPAAGAASAPPAATAPAAAAAPSQITPQVKEMVADEVTRQVKQESIEAQENAQNKDPKPGEGGVVQELSNKEPHVFVVAQDLDLVDPAGRRCMISEGDVVQVISGPKPSTGTADAVVLASKGGVECERAAQVEVALTDLQEMQNHMRETVDQGMSMSSAGKAAATATPAFAASAPPPDPNAAQEIAQQKQIAAAAEG